jgi:ABC-type nitrate/sulfonate/bicarbonate transport system substrate-binding protein
MYAGISALSGALLARPAKGATPLRVGNIKVPHWAAVWMIPDFLPKSVSVEMVEFKTSLEMIAAMSAGSLDVATIGYWHLVRLLDQGADVKAISGVCSGGTRLVVRKGAGIKTWADLRGKACAVSRGSTQDLQFLLALKSNGMGIKDIDYRDLGSNMAVQISALQKGEIDAASMWEPFASYVIAQDIATNFSTLYGQSFHVNGLMVLPTANLSANREQVQAVVSALVKSTDSLLADPQQRLQFSMKLSGFNQSTMELANQNSILEYILRKKEAKAMAAGAHEFGYAHSDVSPKMDSALDYTLLEAATSKHANELGA